MKDKVVLITGASSGIGEALAHTFARQGSHLALAARSADALAQLQQTLTAKYGVQVWVQPTDVTDAQACKTLVQGAVDTFGRLDVLIANAGITMRAQLKDATPEVLRQVMEVNLWGAVYCVHAGLPHLLASKGSIVGVSSIAGYRGLPERTGYSASKFALNGFLESLRTELLPTGVHVLTACPGFTASNIRKAALTGAGATQGESQRDEGKMMSAEAVAEAIYKATVGRRRTLILTTQGKLTVFLNKWLPAWMDRMVYKHLQKEANSSLK
jgi:short-subunit dehydrogenase